MPTAIHQTRLAVLGAALVTLGSSTAAPATGLAPREAFDLLKALAGEWHGTVTEPDTGPAVTVLYRVTAGDSVVEERLFPGTPHEMVTMYHLDNGELVLTHYCAMGNQPRMALADGSTRERLEFAFRFAGNLSSPDAMHMHSGWIRLLGPDHLEAAWAVFAKGAKVGENRFFLRRRSPE